MFFDTCSNLLEWFKGLRTTLKRLKTFGAKIVLTNRILFEMSANMLFKPDVFVLF